MDDLIKEFLIESHENLDRLERDLVVLERDPHDKETLSSIFRTIHTLKGSAGFLGYGQLEAVSHVGENLLSRMRDGLLVINPEIAGALLSTVDVVRRMLGEIESNGAPEERDYSQLISLLDRLKDGPSATAEGTSAATVPLPEVPKPKVPATKQEPTVVEAAPAAAVIKTSSNTEKVKEASEDFEQADHDNTAPVPSPVPSSASEEKKPVPAAPTPPPAPKQVAVVPVPTQVDAHQPVVSTAMENAMTSATADHPEQRSSAASDSSIRVDVSLLDKLMNLVGELVLARNQVLQFTSQHADSAFLATAQRLNLITTELQGSAMKTRMQPIGNIWSKLPRVVRDLSASCGKEIRLEMEGKETELDKTIIEAIKDPLTHIVRNSVDHGIESPEVRLERGKPAEGCLKMRAFHEGGQVNIEIIDDGGGIDLGRVKAKAVQKGIISPEQAGRMSEHEGLHLIFMPGFSTAEKITNVSGRGVGMDVVKTNIEKIGGTVDIQSILGKGTTLKIKIPLTLAIIPALIINSGKERFAIPQISLLELVRLEAKTAREQIESIHGAPVYRLRGKLLPLVYLNRELALGGETDSRDHEREVNIIVLQADGHPFGLVVDEINDTQEIVVKPLGKQLKGVSCFAGATIMGDGRVALILDVLGLAQQSRVVAEVHSRNSHHESAAAAEARKQLDQKQTLLLFSVREGSRMAIPLSMVARLEEFQRSSVEFSGGKPVVRYRGQILPLLQVSEHLPITGPASETPEGDSMQVVVYTEKGRSVGLVVGKIDDIVSEVITEKRHAFGNGILGSIVVQDQVTDLLDVHTIIRSSDPSFFPSKPSPSAAA
jgi:two-component system, chemotaxis family, sensor kinase CheA